MTDGATTEEIDVTSGLKRGYTLISTLSRGYTSISTSINLVIEEWRKRYKPFGVEVLYTLVWREDGWRVNKEASENSSNGATVC